MSIEVLTVEGLAEALQAAKITIYRWEAEGLLPPAKRIGRKLFWLKSEIADFLNEKSQASNVPKQSESQSKRRARNAAAMREFSEKHGRKNTKGGK